MGSDATDARASGASLMHLEGEFLPAPLVAVSPTCRVVLQMMFSSNVGARFLPVLLVAVRLACSKCWSHAA